MKSRPSLVPRIGRTPTIMEQMQNNTGIRDVGQTLCLNLPLRWTRQDRPQKYNEPTSRHGYLCQRSLFSPFHQAHRHKSRSPTEGWALSAQNSLLAIAQPQREECSFMQVLVAFGGPSGIPGNSTENTQIAPPRRFSLRVGA